MSLIVTSMIIVMMLAGCSGNDDSNPSNPNQPPGEGFFVSPTGNDGNPGTDQEPFATLQTAIDNAAATGEITNVYVAEGTYILTRPLELKSKVKLLGGYDASSWQRDIQANQSLIQGYADSVTIRGRHADSVMIDGFTIVGADASQPQSGSPGKNSVAIALDSSLAVVISNDSIVAGIASAGNNGTAGANGAAGSNGGTGENAGLCPNAGGGGGGNYSAGGNGGSGGDFGGFNGGGGSGPAGGAGGDGGSIGGDGGDGGNGGNGVAGASGAGGLSFGTLNGIIYGPSNATDGAPGTNGSGGGGGGGGGGIIIGSCGGGGGGGGGGGQRGLGGTRGFGGGASIAIVLANGTTAHIDSNVIVSLSGGNGGNGGIGGTGNYGGYYGWGGEPGGGGAGGYGGYGGTGGNGGRGGGGGGGPTIGILEDASSFSVLESNDITPGTPGVGGSQGQGNAGEDGIRQAYRKLD